MQLKLLYVCCIFAIFQVQTSVASCRNASSNLTSFIFLQNSSSLLEYLDFQVTCFSSNIIIRLDRCALTNIGYLGSVGLFDFSDRPYDDAMCRNEDSNNQMFIILHGNFSNCAHKVTETVSGFLYEFELRNINNYTSASFSRLPTLKMHFSCKFQLAHEFSFQNDLLLDPDDKVIDISSDTINHIPNEVFGSSFLLYNDSSFLHPLSSNETLIIQVPQFVYFEVSTEAGSNYIIQGQKCWATPTSNSNDVTNYIIIEDGCPSVDPLFSDANIAFTNYISTKFQVGFQSFSWSNGATGLYLHCKIDLCDTNTQATCYDNPCTSSTPKRRDVTQHRNGHHMFTYSGIRLKNDERSCNYGNGGCSHVCVGALHGVKCECPDHFDLLEDGKTCTEWTSDFLAKNLGREINLAIHQEGGLTTTYSDDLVRLKGALLVAFCLGFIAFGLYLLTHHHHRWRNKKTLNPS